MSADASDEATQAWILGGSPPSAGESVRAFGLSPTERLTRSLARSGVRQVRILSQQETVAEPPGRSAVFRPDYFYDERLVAALLDAPDTVLCRTEADGQPAEAVAANVSGSLLAPAAEWLRSGADSPTEANELRRVRPTDLVPAYNAQLRKHDPPYIYPATSESVRASENQIFSASYKGITDFITKHVFPLPARAVVRVLARRGVRPNSVTAVGYLLTALVIVLFAMGHFALGLVGAWAMTFLDTVDGKLARVTLTSSKLGGALDHGLDLVHPPIWWWAWAVGLGLNGGLDGFRQLGDDPALAIAMWITVWGYVVGRLLEGVFLSLFGMEIFTWRRFDSFFRGIIARRNPNLLILSVGLGLGHPDLAYAGVAVWTLACIVIVAARIAQAHAVKRGGDSIRPWHEEQAA